MGLHAGPHRLRRLAQMERLFAERQGRFFDSEVGRQGPWEVTDGPEAREEDELEWAGCGRHRDRGLGNGPRSGKPDRCGGLNLRSVLGLQATYDTTHISGNALSPFPSSREPVFCSFIFPVFPTMASLLAFSVGGFQLGLCPYRSLLVLKTFKTDISMRGVCSERASVLCTAVTVHLRPVLYNIFEY